MFDVVHTGRSHVRPADQVGDERGTTTLDYLMVVVLAVAAIVMVASVGASLTGTGVA